MAVASRILRIMVFNRKTLAIFGLLVISGFLRLYQIDRYMQFQGDEGRDALVLWQMIIEKKFTLIGPGTSIGNMYNGPLYYYLVLPSFLFAGLSPVGPSVFVALLGVATVWFIYKVGSEWFSPMAGSTAAVLYALSPTVIIYSRSSWNPNVMPFFSLLCIYALWKVYKGEKMWWLIVSFSSLAFAIQSHYLGLLLIPTIIFWWFLTWRHLANNGSEAKFKQFSVYSIMIFSFLMSPILLFDLRHKFINLKAMWAFFSQRQETVNFKVYKALPNIIPIFNRIITTLMVAGERNAGFFMSAVSGFGGIFLFRKRYKKIHLEILITWITFGLVGLGLYKQSIYDHYFGFLFPAVFIFFGAVAGFFWERKKVYRGVVVVILFSLLLINVSRAPILAVPNDLYQHTEIISRTIMEKSEGRPFNLGMIAKQNYDDGYRFVLKKFDATLREVPPDRTEQLFVICELPPSECKPVGNPKAEIANFGWVKIDQSWIFSWGVTLFRLVPYKP